MLRIEPKRGDDFKAFTFPENWKEVTLKQAKDYLALDITDPNYPALVLSIFSAQPVSFFNKHKDVAYQLLEIQSKYLNTPPDFSPSRSITYQDKRYTLPARMEEVQFGVYNDALAIAGQIQGREPSMLEIVECYETITKMLLYDRICIADDEVVTFNAKDGSLNLIARNKEYTSKDALALNIDMLMYHEVIGWGSFFFQWLVKLNHGIKERSKKAQDPEVKNRRGVATIIKNWARSLVLFGRYGY